MVGTKAIGLAYAVLLATVFACLIAGGLSSSLPISIRVTIFVGLWIAIFFCGLWIHERGEANKRIPVSSRELRRRTKAFYDWLASQGRR